jgi:RHS repeat-associated protein
MFAGVRYDIEIGLYYNRARYYNPYTGRFLQTDPVGYDDGINWYRYCANNPLNNVDPSGRFMLPGVVVADIIDRMFPKPNYGGTWGIRDFLGWYAHGEGVRVDLGDVGLLGKFRNSEQISSWTGALQTEMDEMAKNWAKLMLSQGKARARLTFSREHEYHFAPQGSLALMAIDALTDPLFVLGDGTLTADITIQAKRLEPNHARWWVYIKYSINDRFKDPSDLRDTKEGESEWPGCEPYDIIGHWEYVNSGTIWWKS